MTCKYQSEIKKPHKHAELIKAWADGAEIEFFNLDTAEWFETEAPSWALHMQYRIKPEPKPDLIVNAVIQFKNSWATPSIRYSWNGDCPERYKHNLKLGNVIKFTLDGETNELKRVEVIK